MYDLLSKTHPKARTTHRCIWCGETIEKGEKYIHEKSIFDGNFQNHKWHNECDKAFKEEMKEGHGETEFSAYDNERPSKT